MKSKRGALGILIVGGVLIVIALVIKFVVYPSMAMFPADVDATRTYEGTLHRLLNPEAAAALQDPASLATFDPTMLFLSEIPVKIDRHVTTEETKGDKAIVLEEVRTFGPDGSPIPLLSADYWYAINRKTMNAVPDFSGNDKIPDREGLVIGFPIGTKKQDYPGWNGDAQVTGMAEFVREEKRGGLDTYVFEGKSSPKEIVDPEKLALFPPGVPKDVLVGLAGMLQMSDDDAAMFAQILANLPDPVPLKYTYEYETTYWIEPTTGVLIDYTKHEMRQAAFDTGAAPFPFLSVFELSFSTSAGSVEDAAKDAKDAKGLIDLYGTTVPMILIVVGLVLGVIGVVLFLRKPAAAEGE